MNKVKMIKLVWEIIQATEDFNKVGYTEDGCILIRKQRGDLWLAKTIVEKLIEAKGEIK